MNWLTVCTLLCMPDARYLARVADSAGIPPVVLLAVAWQETRNNVNPAVRGAHGEVGRMQILPATAEGLCRGLDIRRYRFNVECGALILKARSAFGWAAAIKAYNGGGEAAATYADEVMTTIGRWRLEQQH